MNAAGTNSIRVVAQGVRDAIAKVIRKAGGQLHDETDAVARLTRTSTEAVTRADSASSDIVRWSADIPAERPSVPPDLRNDGWAGYEAPESVLGVHTPADHAMEASLVIDTPLLEAAVVAGHAEPGVLFGQNAWNDYLEARAFTRQHGDRELTVDFMIELHRTLTGSRPSIAGKLATSKRWAGWGHPITAAERAAIDENLYVKLLTPDDIPLLHGGVEYLVSSPEAVERELAALANRYNQARLLPNADPYRLAAQLQRDAVSIHPFNDYNGRFSRSLMNWSLERDGVAPSALADFNGDLGSSMSTWTDAVRAGSDLYAERAARLARLGEQADPIEVFSLERTRENLQSTGKQLEFLPGDDHDIEAYRALMAGLRSP